MAEPTKVRIAVEAARELEFEVEDADAMVAALEAAIAAGDEMAWIVDHEGDRHGIRVGRLAFIEIEGGDHQTGVGFGRESTKG